MPLMETSPTESIRRNSTRSSSAIFLRVVGASPSKAMIIPVVSPKLSMMSGSMTPVGNWAWASFTFDRNFCHSMSVSEPYCTLTKTTDIFAREIELTFFRLSIVSKESSSFRVTCSSTFSAPAPGYIVMTSAVATLISGDSRRDMLR